MDYKTTESADPFSFQRLLINLDYDLQAAHYCEAQRAAEPGLDRDPDFVLLVQEREPPFACSLVGIDPMLLDLGARKCERASAIWKSCLASGKWPGYSSRIHWASAPAWAMAAFEERGAQ